MDHIGLILVRILSETSVATREVGRACMSECMVMQEQHDLQCTPGHLYTGNTQGHSLHMSSIAVQHLREHFMVPTHLHRPFYQHPCSILMSTEVLAAWINELKMFHPANAKCTCRHRGSTWPCSVYSFSHSRIQPSRWSEAYRSELSQCMGRQDQLYCCMHRGFKISCHLYDSRSNSWTIQEKPGQLAAEWWSR